MVAESLLKLRIVPNAARDDIIGPYGDALKIKLRAQAVDGKANAALIEFLAVKLGLTRAHVHIQSGESSRTKIVRISGMTSDEAFKKLLGNPGT